ncbi:hypothetical protein BDB01DRAFT_851671 [Pilobolus umbonatus]|nr:hypothetical protein BDB01DRAFT_851671 [Pilobolus umbonatus]
MIERSPRFPVVCNMGATYNSNSLGMPLIVAYGVFNIGQVDLKTFHMGLAYVTGKREETSIWFLETLKGVVIQFNDETVKVAGVIITRDIDRTISEIERVDKEEKWLAVSISHRNAMRVRMGQCFNTPDCSLMLVDAFNLLMCEYSDAAEKNSFSVTYLPIGLPDKLSNK